MKVKEIFEATKKSFPIAQKYKLLLDELKKNLAGESQLIYNTSQLEKLIKTFASKNELSYKKVRVQPKSVGDEWNHIRGSNNWTFELIAPDESAIFVTVGDSNGDINLYDIEVSAYNKNGGTIKSSKIK